MQRVVDVDNMHIRTANHESRRREGHTVDRRRARHSLRRREAAQDPGPDALQPHPLEELHGNRRRDQELEARIYLYGFERGPHNCGGLASARYDALDAGIYTDPRRPIAADGGLVSRPRQSMRRTTRSLVSLCR